VAQEKLWCILAAKKPPRTGYEQRTLTELDTTCNQLPEPLRGMVQAVLEPGESLRAVFQPDLDNQLKYCDGLVVLTDRRLLARAGADLHAWPLAQVERLQAATGRLATLEALGPSARLACWYHTVGRAAAAHDLVDAFDRLTAGPRPRPGSRRRPGCAEGEKPTAPVNVRSLFRLFRFARPTPLR